MVSREAQVKYSCVWLILLIHTQPIPLRGASMYGFGNPNSLGVFGGSFRALFGESKGCPYFEVQKSSKRLACPKRAGDSFRARPVGKLGARLHLAILTELGRA